MARLPDEPWERIQGESPQAYEAFCVYRDMGPERRLNAVALKLHKSYTLIRRWKGEYDWIERVRKYENHLERVDVAKRKQKLKQINERHLIAANTLLQKALERLQTMDEADMKKASLRSVAEALKIAAEIQRGALAPTQEELLKMKYELEAAQTEEVDDWGTLVDTAFEYDAAREDTGDES